MDPLEQAYQKLIDAMMSGNREKFEEAVREFNATLAEQQRQFNLSLGQQQLQWTQGLYSGMAQNLLGTAAGLTGPKDWQKYQEYTSGGRDVFGALFGNQPLPQSAAPSGTSAPLTVADILAQLGIGPMPTQGQTPPAGPDPNAALDYIYSTRPDIGTFYASNGWDLSTPEKQRLAVQDWLKMTDEPSVIGWGRDPMQVATGLGWKPPIAPSSGIQEPGPGIRVTQNPQMPSPGIQESGPGIAPGEPPTGPYPTGGALRVGPASPYPLGVQLMPGEGAPAQAPLPNQMNPAVWDSLSPTAKQMVYGLLQAGKTSSGYWDPNDWLTQMNATRPRGTNPQSVQTAWQTPRGW